jgi:hypothetical protein
MESDEDKIKLHNDLQKFQIEKSIVGTEAYNIEQDLMKGISQEEILEKARSGVYKPTKQNLKEGIVGQKYGQEKKEEVKDQNFKNIAFKDKSDKILSFIKDKLRFESNYKIDQSDNRLLIKHKKKDSSIDIMPAERVFGGEDSKGNIYLHLFDKSEIKSTSLADPRAAYQTTSARIVKHKNINKTKEISNYKDLEKEIEKFLEVTQ